MRNFFDLQIIRFSVFCFIIIGSFLSGYPRSPEDIENPNLKDRRQYVADPDGLVDEVSEQNINSILADLRQKTGAEGSVVVVSSLDGIPIEEFSEKIFTKWGIGKSDRDNGFLIVLAVNDRQARIETGYGLEGLIPDITAKEIIDKTMVPQLKEGKVGLGLLGATANINSILTTPEAIEEIKSGQREKWELPPEGDIDGSDLVAFVIWVAVIMFLISLGLYINDSIKIRKKDRLQQAYAWHDRRSLYKFFAIFSLGLGLLPFFLAERKRKRSREAPYSCPRCHQKMVKLNEEEDNNYLSASEDLEERLNTVDYDVWICPDCGEIRRYPFKIKQLLYSECPACHTIALGLKQDRIIRPATNNRAGEGERIYECRHCRHQKHERYTIPRRQNNAAIAAGIAAGSMLGGRNHGGGFGGGSGIGGGFGGGRTGGGGASGRW